MLGEATLRSLAIMEPKISMYITVTKMSMHKTRLQSVIAILMFISKAFAILVRSIRFNVFLVY